MIGPVQPGGRGITTCSDLVLWAAAPGPAEEFMAQDPPRMSTTSYSPPRNQPKIILNWASLFFFFLIDLILRT